MSERKYKKLFIKTWGCQMNMYDSQKMADILALLGYRPADRPDDADMIILNTCHIREKATEKVFSELGRLKQHKIEKEKSGGQTIMAVAGCVAQAEGDLIFKRAPYVDLVFGPQTYHRLPEMVLEVFNDPKMRIIDTEFPAEPKFDDLPEESISATASAYLSVQEGCDKFCTFCVVPYTRGAEFSRPALKVIEEAKRIAGNGGKEITLLGQNVNAYHGEGPDGRQWDLARLIENIALIDGIERIRYTTSHPRDMTDSLIRAHGDVQKLMPFLHLPVQSGSDKVLKLMNRKHKAELYYDIIQKLRARCPDIALSSDFIVGFPGETDQDFEDTMTLVKDIEYIYAYSFKYSPRPGTPAASMNGLVHEKVKTERLARLQALLNQQQHGFNKATEGKTIPVLFERYSAEKNQLHGRSPHNQAVHVYGPENMVGRIADVAIISGGPNSLNGQLINDNDYKTPGISESPAVEYA